MSTFLDNFIPDRIRIIKEDKDTLHICQILQKHLFGSISEIKDKYNPILIMYKNELIFNGNMTDIYELFSYLERKGLKFKSIAQTSLRVDIDDFIRKVY